MKHILIASAALLGAALTAQAADMPAKAPYYKAPLVSVYNWTGFYVGVNAGVGLGRDRTTRILPGGAADSFYVSPQGAAGGGQVGYNWQADSLFGPIVYGIEADIQGADFKDGATTLTGFAGLPTKYSQQIDWFGTVRGRVGLAKGPVLSYITGGYAYGNVKTSVAETGATVFSDSKIQGGWTLGSGVEASLGGNWTGKIEYLYVNMGNKSYRFTGAGAETLSTELRQNIFRVGLNYRIGGNGVSTPVAAANRTGWYLGGNFGSGTARNRSTLSSLVVAPAEQFNLTPDGFIGGVQAGYNWQAANWVYGIEADFQGSTQKDNKTCVLTCNGSVALLSAAYDAKLPWFGTVRGRLGYSVGSTLFYATGGFAYGSVKTKVTSTFFGVPTANTINATRGGWTVGGGIETPFKLVGLFGPNWTSKSEYLYVDLGSSTGVLGTTGLTSTTRVNEHIFRTGLNYHFSSPVVAKY